MTDHLVRAHLAPCARTLLVQLVQPRDDVLDGPRLTERIHGYCRLPPALSPATCPLLPAACPCPPPTANSPRAVRTYIMPSDNAGVAISKSAIGFTASCLNSRPAATTIMSPSSLPR